MTRHPSLIRHLVWFDLRAMSKVIAGWLAVLALQSSVIWMGPPEPVVGAADSPDLHLEAIVARLALTVVMVATLVHRHPLVGTRAFWRTRPITPAGLLASKLVVIGLVAVVLPFVWFLATFLLLGLPAGVAVGGAGAIALEQALVAGLSWVLASLSANLAQLVVGMIGTLVTFGISSTVLKGVPKPFAVTIRDGSLIEPGLSLIMATALLLLAAHQHLTLKTRRSLALTIVMLAVTTGIMGIRPWRVVELPASDLLGGLPVVAPGTMDLATMRERHQRRWSDRGVEDVVEYEAFVKAPDGDSSLILRPVAVSAVLSFPDGVPVRYDWPATSSWLENVFEAEGEAGRPYAALEAPLGTPLIVPRGTPWRMYRGDVFAVSESTYSQRSRQPGDLSVRLQCEARRYVAVGTMRLPDRALSVAPTGTLTFERAVQIPDGVAVTIRGAGLGGWPAPDPSYYGLRNQPGRQTVLLAETFVAQRRTTLLTQWGVVVMRTRLEATFPGDSVASGMVTAEWLKAAELVWLRPQVVGRTEWTTHVPGFMLDTAFAKAAKAVSAEEAK